MLLLLDGFTTGWMNVTGAAQRQREIAEGTKRLPLALPLGHCFSVPGVRSPGGGDLVCLVPCCVLS